jgi:hypothetical protein
VSPRRNYRRRDAESPIDRDRVRRGVEAVQAHADGEWLVRKVTSQDKTYRCPGCHQEIRPGVEHVVTWPADERGDLTDRRHWHTGCWRARDRRAPGVERSRNAPRYG